MGDDATCRDCGAPVKWYKTTKGKNIPLDPEGRRMATLMRDGETVWLADCYMIHWDTCPAREKRPEDQPRQYVPREKRDQAPSAPPAGRPPDDDIPF